MQNSLNVGNFYISDTQNALFLVFTTFENDLIFYLSVPSTRMKILEKRKCVSGDHPIGTLLPISEQSSSCHYSLWVFFLMKKWINEWLIDSKLLLF